MDFAISTRAAENRKRIGAKLSEVPRTNDLARLRNRIEYIKLDYMLPLGLLLNSSNVYAFLYKEAESV